MKSSDVLNQMAQADQHLQPRRKVLSAILGNGDGSTVKVTDRPGYSWIRLHGSQSELVQALNRTIANTHGLQVDVSVLTDRRGGQTSYEVIGLSSNDILTAGGTLPFEPYLPEHAASHEWPTVGRGRDVINIYPRAFAFGRVYPTSPASMRCVVAPVDYFYGNALKYFPGGQTIDFTAELPASAGLAKLAYVCIDGETNNLDYIYTDEFAWSGYIDPVPNSTWLEVTAGYLLCGTPILYNGLTAIVEQNFRYDRKPILQVVGNAAVVADQYVIAQDGGGAWMNVIAEDALGNMVYVYADN